ncbi:MAG TPA: RteC domain-containing protein [Dysgonomonas sp.]|uniref:RteC domain-containing protein n=1 Tax=unclassified Dysgonomonas TaxID=2630389 RepID=UPI0025C051F5|nr:MULTISPECIES: RteC domain-containing protein [unclassified Dysgonomonas]HML65312.1 RteC domain-containing protein [Dysgonomonas sp.]
MDNKINGSYDRLFTTIINSSDETLVKERFYAFIKDLMDYCSNERRVFSTYRVLNEIKADVTIRNRTIDLSICNIFERIYAFIDTEIAIAMCKIKNTNLIDIDCLPGNDLPVPLRWTNDKTALVALIYSIANSINSGKADISEIKKCFEYIFQIDLGDIYQTFSKFQGQKDPCKYLRTLPDNLLIKINEKLI